MTKLEKTLFQIKGVFDGLCKVECPGRVWVLYWPGEYETAFYSSLRPEGIFRGWLEVREMELQVEILCSMNYLWVKKEVATKN